MTAAGQQPMKIRAGWDRSRFWPVCCPSEATVSRQAPYEVRGAGSREPASCFSAVGRLALGCEVGELDGSALAFGSVETSAYRTAAAVPTSGAGLDLKSRPRLIRATRLRAARGCASGVVWSGCLTSSSRRPGAA